MHIEIWTSPFPTNYIGREKDTAHILEGILEGKNMLHFTVGYVTTYILLFLLFLLPAPSFR